MVLVETIHMASESLHLPGSHLIFKDYSIQVGNQISTLRTDQNSDPMRAISYLGDRVDKYKRLCRPAN